MFTFDCHEIYIIGIFVENGDKGNINSNMNTLMAATLFLVFTIQKLISPNTLHRFFHLRRISPLLLTFAIHFFYAEPYESNNQTFDAFHEACPLLQLLAIKDFHIFVTDDYLRFDGSISICLISSY
ncbi:unnamed protein product [Cunninghamella echinulata]